MQQGHFIQSETSAIYREMSSTPVWCSFVA